MSSMQLSSSVSAAQAKSSSRSANLLLDRGLGRVQSVIATWLVACTINIVLFGIGAAAGLTYNVEDGQSVWGLMGVGTLVVTTVLLVTGMTLAALLSRRWGGIIRVAQIVGPAISLLTIALTYLAFADRASATVLALMHVAAVPVMIVGLELIARRDAWTRR